MNLENTLLMIPGPIPVSPRILRAMSKPMINHRSKEFSAIYTESRQILAELFGTKNDIFILSGSGSCAMEAAIGNVIDEKDTLVTIENGKFGERFREIGELAKKYGALFIMDGVTTIGGDEVLVDKWGVDIAVVGSQKCIGAPPGLSAISVSETAWASLVKKPPYYMDLKAYRKSANGNLAETPYTPAIPLFFALHEALRIVREEGLPVRIKRNARFAEAIRAAAGAMNLELFPQLNKHSRYSNTVTAMKIPPGIDDKKLCGGIKELGVQVSGGQGLLDGKIFRIGSMGNISKLDILTTIQAVEIVLYRNGVVKTIGTGMEAASGILN